MKTKRGLLTLAATTVLMATSAWAGNDVGSWYITPQINSSWLGDERNADDDLGFRIGFGKVLAENWDAELGFFTASHGAGGSNNLSLKGFDLGVNRVWYRDARVQPFISLGLGKLESKFQGNVDGDMFLRYGVGFQGDLAKNTLKGTNLQLRGDLFGRRAYTKVGNQDSIVDYVAALGIQYSWGGTIVTPPPPDSDGDGVPDNMDKCPDTPAGTQVNADGCPLDSDGDGVRDSDDKCPGTPAGTPVDANGCELDADGDGVSDSKDKCPNTPAGAKVDADGCELDSDGDGVVDSKDQCPDTPKGDRVDMFGCSFKTEIKLPGVVFDTASADLRPESYPILDGAAEVLKRYPDLRIEVAGHTDSRSSDAYNLNLSNRRAATVAKYLADKGVTNTLSSRGYGERQPIASNKTDEGMQQNRRVVLRVLN
jgi:OOP family OmpA-OmpF porin